jgi:glucose-6-phosphate dehydrogenase assembly protein OpcA
MNLVVVTDEESELDEVANSVGDLTVEHPNRSFIVCAERDRKEPSLCAWISVRCSLPVAGNGLEEDQAKQVCCEQVALKATGEDVAKLPSVIMSLLVPDVPTVLIWKGELDSRDEVLLSLVKICDRVLIDSSVDPDPERRLVVWGNMFGSSSKDTAFGDLSWTHASTWRGVIADAFQPMETRKHLQAIDSISVRYSSRLLPSHSGLSQALLTVGWIAHVLHWKYARSLQHAPGDGYGGLARLGDQAIQIHILPVEDGVQRQGEIESVEFHSSMGLELLIQTTDSRDSVRLVRRTGDGSAVDRVLLVRNKSEAELLSAELEEIHAGGLYRASMMSLLGLFGNGK